MLNIYINNNMVNNKRVSKKTYKTKNQSRSKRARYVMSGGGFTINVKTLTGITLKLTDIRADTTIREIKLKIQDTQGIHPDQQRLIFAGHHLADETIVAFFNGFSKDCTIHLVLRLRGGMHHKSSTGEEVSDEDRPYVYSPLTPHQMMERSRESTRSIFRMGFEFNQVLEKLNETDNDEARAIELILSETHSPIAPRDERHIFQMGFDPHRVTAALERTNNDEERAIVLLLDGFH